MKDVNLINEWGIKFNPISLSEFISIIEYRIESGLPVTHITGVNPETVVHASKNSTVRNAIANSDLVNVDNHFVAITLRMLGYSIPERVATPDLFEELLRLSNANGLKVFILGSKQEILEIALEKIISDYPNICIQGKNGYFKNEENIIDEIKHFSPDMLFIAMPSPFKESFILKYKDKIRVKVILGIGGAIDVKAGLVKRAPHFLRKIGLEGLHRTLQNPVNYGKRYLDFYPKFILIVIKSLSCKKLKK